MSAQELRARLRQWIAAHKRGRLVMTRGMARDVDRNRRAADRLDAAIQEMLNR